jgi:hypothetical protein
VVFNLQHVFLKLDPCGDHVWVRREKGLYVVGAANTVEVLEL